MANPSSGPAPARGRSIGGAPPAATTCPGSSVQLYWLPLGAGTGASDRVVRLSGRLYDRGVVAEGPVGLSVLAGLRLFRYEVRCWRDGVLGDAACAVRSPLLLSGDHEHSARVLACLPEFPVATWARTSSGRVRCGTPTPSSPGSSP